MTKKEIENLKQETIALLSEIGTQAEVKVDFLKEENLLNIQIDSPQAAYLIGFHGETLQALQLILTFFVHKQIGSWMKLNVNVGDYRQKREEQLKKLALNLAMKAKFSKEAQSIPNLNSMERRFIHLILADHPDVYTQSEGEGRERQLIIKPKG
jgi:spoIIIJ-associated protein